MSPELKEGDYVLSFSKNTKKLKIGDTIIFKDPVHGRLIKKIINIEKKGFKVKGTHPDSSNSETLGIIACSNILGKVIFIIPKK